MLRGCALRSAEPRACCGWGVMVVLRSRGSTIWASRLLRPQKGSPRPPVTGAVLVGWSMAARQAACASARSSSLIAASALDVSALAQRMRAR
jgi:hypothetical protein